MFSPSAMDLLMAWIMCIDVSKFIQKKLVRSISQTFVIHTFFYVDAVAVDFTDK